jgi:hypothetical protein
VEKKLKSNGAAGGVPLSQARHQAALAAADPDFSLAFTNWSSDTMECIDWEVDLSAITGEIVQTPPDTLATSYQGVLSWYQLISGFATGNNAGWVVYQTPAGQVFGVKIIVPVQVFGIGPRPYWEVTTDGQNWSGNYTSDNYTFDTSVGYNITCSAQSSHSSLFLSISIKDLSKKAKRGV